MAPRRKASAEGSGAQQSGDANKKAKADEAPIAIATVCCVCGAKPKSDVEPNGSDWCSHSRVGDQLVPVEPLCKKCDEDR